MRNLFLSGLKNAGRQLLVAALLLLSISDQGFAGVDPPVVQVLDGSQGQVVNNATVMVEDAKFFDPAYYGKLVKPYPVRNMLSLQINEHDPHVIQDSFTLKITLAISFIRNDSTSGSEQRIFTVNYNANSSYAHKDVYIFKNCSRVTAQIISIDSGNATWNVSRVVKVVNQLQSLPVYEFLCDENAVQVINDSAWASDTDKDELPVYWPPSMGADEYDLEWTYIDSSALSSGRYGDTANPSANLIFDNNASRVTISGTYYTIPLIYDNSGFLFFRVRAVQWQPGGGRNESNWSSDYTPGGLGKFEFKGHERLLNWQATTTYAEEGKRKIVIQYFDGSLRGRQTVTKDNSTGTTIVAESFYDYQGRPVIQVLPAPTINNVIQYNQGFNVGLNGNIYDKFNYDTLDDPTDYCTTGAAPMDTVSGASRYYSPNNELIDSNFHQYIPDANGYPFTEVQYTRDNTGRISSQSGVGDAFRIGGGHETKYFYNSADQRELDALFGTEVGDASHYFKTMVRDANGQYSVSYSDMHGRTVATALAGKVPDSIKLEALPSYATAMRMEDLSNPSATVINGLVMENKKSITVTKMDYYTFSYRLDTLAIQLPGCDEANLCYDCLYDLEITIASDCNTFDTAVNNFSISNIDSVCNNGTGFNFSFTKLLPEGSYDITKKLSVSRYGLDFYRDSIFMQANSCKTLNGFVNEQRQLLAGVLQCEPDCQSCKDSLGTFDEFWEKYKRSVGVEAPDTIVYMNIALAAYNQALEQCAMICDSLVYENNDIRKSMLMDMTPSSGQYANLANETDTFSIFFSRSNGVSPDTLPDYEQVDTYLDEDGNPDMVYDESTGGLVSPKDLTPEAFAQNFKPSWAEALLPKHPEYVKLLWYDALSASHEWDRRFAATDSWLDAKDKGYLNPTNLNSSPFNNWNGSPQSLDIDPLSTGTDGTTFKGLLEDSLRHYRNTTSDGYVSLWSVATLAVTCTDGEGESCYDKYLSPDSTFTYEHGLCDGQLDMAWRAFREMYLNIKHNIINAWLSIKCPDCTSAAIMLAAGHQPHFSDARELLIANEIDLPDDPADVLDQYNQKIGDYYESNCENYARLWWKQLAPCNFDLQRDSAAIISRLVRICREGSDQHHPYGSSNIAPSSTYEWDSFEQFLHYYCDSVGIDYNATCNVFLIPAPRPYNNQVVNGNKPVYGKPDDCECSAISAFYTKYQASSGFSSFSQYMQQVHGTMMSDSDLNTLLAYCEISGSSPSCPVLSQPIYLPPAFQCYTGDVCITCEQFNVLNQAFYDSFPGAHPASINSPFVDSSTWKWNELYARFLNYRLGFSFSADEYLNFSTQCKIGFGDANCDSLQQLMDDFRNDFVHDQGVEITFSTQEGETFTDLHDLISNGAILLPDAVRERTGTQGYNNVTYRQLGSKNYCWSPDGYTIETRFRFIKDLQGGQVFYFEAQNMAVVFSRFPTSAVVDSVLIPAGLYLTALKDNYGNEYGSDFGGAGFGHALADSDPNGLLNWNTLKLKVTRASYYVCWNGNLVQSISRDTSLPIVNSTTYTHGLRSRHGNVDWIKMYDANGTLRYFEDFLNPDNPVVPDNNYLCPGAAPDCKDAFVIYFNQLQGTNYTFGQIDSIYQSTCYIGADPCSGQTPANILADWQNDYKKYGWIPHLDATGGDTTKWKVDFGGIYWNVKPPMGEVFRNGIARLPDSYLDTLVTSENRVDFDIFDTLCFDTAGFDFELRFRLPDSVWISNGFGASWWIRLGGDSTTSGALLIGLSPLDGRGASICTHHDDSQKSCTDVNVPAQHFNDWRTVKLQFRGTDFKLFVDTSQLIHTTLTAPFTKLWRYWTITSWSLKGEIDYIRIKDTAGNYLYNEEFEDHTDLALFDASLRCEPCETRYTNYFNLRNSSAYTFEQIDSLYNVYAIPFAPCSQPSNPYLTLCGRAAPVFPILALEEIDNCSDSTFFIQSKAQELYKVYVDSLKNRFDSSYLAKCLRAYKFEKFTVYHPVNEFHHTLYYYDQAGNLIKTVPPAGVHANYDSLWLDSVADARLAGQVKTPAHTLVTQYRYNTLNQVVAQQSPDGGKTEFWYDRLGRLALSRNAKQLANSSANHYLYSFTRYDQLGRITQVGQIRENATTSAIDDAWVRNDSALNAWFNTYNNYRHQLTTTVYDEPYFTGAEIPLTVYQRNLRNRVSYVTYSDTATLATSYNNGIFYTYDIAGNVDTLLNDYGQTSLPNMMNMNGNRFKKIVYNYDLISGKVNTVAFQRGWADQFFQRYTYDAENRLILAESSRDSMMWETEATYQYYKHGPLARMVLGHQQVQGIDYAYTLQGWLKGINSTGGSSAHDMGGDGRLGGVNQYTARDALGLTLNYFGGDYSPIRSTVNPFPAYSAYLDNSFRPLYNGNISSSSVYNRRLLAGNDDSVYFYNYHYDQLNRITGMDVYNHFNIQGNNWASMQLAMVNNADSVMKEQVTYDANGNILTYRRNHAGGLLMDNLTYKYYPGTNQLRQITDGVTNDGAFGSDIDNQTDTSNYIYDAIGNMVQDKKEQITNIQWNVYGKITEITRNSTGTVPVTNIKYFYDALGNRIGKVFDLAGNTRYTWYVRDAQGNVLSIYEANPGGNPSLGSLFVYQAEQYLYGSSRLGFLGNAQGVDGGPVSMEFYSGGQFWRGKRQYELTNHLGNVLAVITDKKIGVSSDGSLNDYYNPEIIAANDYYPFGMVARNVTQSIPYTRFGFNGKEFDWEVKGWQNQIDYGMRVYDPRIGRFLSTDPLTYEYPWYTPYQFAGNKPIGKIDLDGTEESDAPTVDPKYKNVNLYKPKAELDPVTKFGIGIVKGAFRLLGALTELPARAHYGNKIKQEDKQEDFPLTGDQNAFTLAVNTFFWPVHVVAQIQKDPSNPEVWGEAVTAFLASGLAAKGKGLSAEIASVARQRINLAIKEFAKEKVPIQQTSGIDFNMRVDKVRLEPGTEVVQWRRPGEDPTGAWYSLPGVDPNTLGIPKEYSVGHVIKLTTSVEVLQSFSAPIENFLKPGSGEILPGGGLQYTSRQIRIGENAAITGYLNRPK